MGVARLATICGMTAGGFNAEVLARCCLGRHVSNVRHDGPLCSVVMDVDRLQMVDHVACSYLLGLSSDLYPPSTIFLASRSKAITA